MSAEARTGLDAASSEPLHPAARDVLLAALDQGYADPRRLHHDGRRARLLLDNAREVVAQSLQLRPDEVTFTSSGTEAVHRGLLGLHRARARHGSTVLHSAVEHSAVHHALRWAGVPTVEVPVTTTGQVTRDAVRTALGASAAPVAVAAVQHANHEVGTVHPVAGIAEELGEVPLFVDACASAGRLPLPDGWAAAAASAHKWGGPAGVGLLLVRKGARWRNPFPEDDRVDPRSSGFENIPAALAAAAALQAMVSEQQELGARQSALVERVRSGVGALPDVEVVGEPSQRLPHLVTFSCLYVGGERLVTELDRLGFGVASGSACTASTLAPSHVLAAMGALTHGNVRLSLGRSADSRAVEALLSALPEVLERLRTEVGL
ncbi:cysteine desulfurase family protein [Nocardioides houyundeii]|uniref:cysteine desulfurase family protein n=1 Tax=Nocardioides houyundeii TaxID=2045452 RepID=UPI0018EF8E0A|nr:aminotransferase class V-fold PLP-dependent enzyme [Nocardioides houyundeii]